LLDSGTRGYAWIALRDGIESIAADPEEVALLAPGLKGRYGTKVATVRALGAAGPAASPWVGELRGILTEYADYGLGEDAARTLGRIGPAAKSALPDLRRLMNSQSVPGIAAAVAVCRIAGADEAALTALDEALGYPLLAPHAARELGDLGIPAKRSAPKLRALMNAEGKGSLDAAYALVRMKDEEADAALAYLIDTLRVSKDDRAEAALLLGRLGDPAPEVVAALTTALDEWGIAEYAARALGDLGPAARPAVPALRRQCDGWYFWLRHTARHALRKIGR
jgi:hypothetical protein